jgi:hypothetical protein
MFNIVTHGPIARQRAQHTRHQQYSSRVSCGPRGDCCYATRDKRDQQYRCGVFHGSDRRLYIENQFVGRGIRELELGVQGVQSENEKENGASSWQ